ncbi:MAG: hypothetical protein JAY85_15150 [Candidatus Thiodiazotropha weberae]|uniref:Uncharacterized protein n=1 Tax=Candidatus Thiodiazotropha endoloripes TaxID=1818881 RepID=A0A1E2UTQ6_9GAMM|nr:hypothetical protein [Candidatus Thiodiazotropha endoloripes]MCG7899778.1 hypothetical protein [Candidatus Thiodiazotropha weberae]ODB98139.1 hypothetical protein A3196_16055 [Candidatus Thiodiazotropha endoloripes]
MDIVLARKYIEALAWLEIPCDHLNNLLLELDENEKEKYKKAVGEIFRGHFELLMPIINRFPELDPDGEGAEFYNAMRMKYLPINT